MPCRMMSIESRSTPKTALMSSAADSETVMMPRVPRMAARTRARHTDSCREERALSIQRLATPWTVTTEGRRVGSSGPVSAE